MVLLNNFPTKETENMDTSGFGGGGGFITDASPMDSSQDKKREQSNAQSLTPCTISMILQAEFQDDTYHFKDMPLHQVKIVAKIREVQESTTNVIYKVSDSTAGGLVVRKWIDKEETSYDKEVRSLCREDMYVRVCGALKKLDGNNVSLVIFKMVPIVDFNEITHHMLDVIYTHLTILKRPELLGNGNSDLSAQTPMKSNGQMNLSISGTTNTTGFSSVQQTVMDAIEACVAEQGLNINDMKSKVGLSEKQLRDAIDFLSNEGHVYSTIDDDHYRSTSS